MKKVTPSASKAGETLVNHRWKTKTTKQKSAYGKMMVEAREIKRREKKLKVESETPDTYEVDLASDF